MLSDQNGKYDYFRTNFSIHCTEGEMNAKIKAALRDVTKLEINRFVSHRAKIQEIWPKLEIKTALYLTRPRYKSVANILKGTQQMRDETTSAIIIRVTFLAVAIALNGCWFWLASFQGAQHDHS